MSDIRSALEEAFKEQAEAPEEPVAPEAEAPADPEAPEAEPAASEGRERDESGRFKAKEPEAKETPPAPAEPAPAPEPVQSRKAPSSWKKEAQEIFLKADRGEALTPDEIKLLTQEAERRESDFHKGVTEFKTHSERARAYDAAIAPYQQHLQSLGVDAPTAINALMRADMTLRTGDPATKAQYFAQLAREYGIDLAQVQNPQPIDPQVQYLQQQMQSLRQQQQLWQNQVQQQEQMKVQSEIAQFATADKTHFEAVRNDMADLLQTGKANTLQEAYDMAVWMRPEIRNTLIEQQRQDAQRKAVEAAQAQRAKAAAVSVKGSTPTSAGGQTPQGSLRDILAAQFADN
jgi:hypothetical protein